LILSFLLSIINGDGRTVKNREKIRKGIKVRFIERIGK